MQRTTDRFTSAADGRFQSVTRIGAGGMGIVYAAVDNRHVCELHDVVNDAGCVCLVLERLVGESLQARLARGRMSNAELLER